MNSIDTLLWVLWCLGIMKNSMFFLHKDQEGILDNSEFNRSSDKELFISKWDFKKWCLTQTPQLELNAEECSYMAIFSNGSIVIKSIRTFQVKKYQSVDKSQCILYFHSTFNLQVLGKQFSYSHLEIMLVVLPKLFLKTSSLFLVLLSGPGLRAPKELAHRPERIYSGVEWSQ